MNDSCKYVKDANKTWTASDDDKGTDKMFFGLWLKDTKGGYTDKGICVRAKRKDGTGKRRSSSTYYSRNALKTKNTYKYKGGLGTYTFTIEGGYQSGVFNKMEFEATDPNDVPCNGTYTPPAPQPN